MGGRRRLKAGAPRVLGRHHGTEGRAYRRVYDALAAALDLATSLLRYEAGRVAALAVQMEAATRALVDAQRARRAGRGRRPSPRELERLARRQGLADQSYSQALEKLRALAAERAPLDLARAIAAAPLLRDPAADGPGALRGGPGCSDPGAPQGAGWPPAPAHISAAVRSAPLPRAGAPAEAGGSVGGPHA